MSDPVIVPRKKSDHVSGRQAADNHPSSARAYVGGNNHHIELRIDESGKWSGEVVSTFEAAQRKLAMLRALREGGVPRMKQLKRMPPEQRCKFRPMIAAAEKAHPIVDRTDNAEKGGVFMMSLCEGEMVFMRHKDNPEEVGYFVVAKLNKPRSVVLVPHWDARAAGERKDSAGKKIPDSKRESFDATPDDFKKLAPPGSDFAVKVRVDVLGRVTEMMKDKVLRK
ncbi:MAG: hypothetical protein IPK83_20195 [Planctomycetes bacterium]|nr:hypothetical protein [Planctomycetota bacterium]